MRAFVRAVVLAAALIVALPATAYAGEGSGRLYTGPSNTGGDSNGWASWSGYNNTVGVEAAAFGIGSGRCISSYFDWRVSSGHYDARAARTCANNRTRHGDTYEWSGVQGMQKFGACYGYNDQLGSCTNHPSADIAVTTSSINPDAPNYTTRFWIHRSDGSTVYYSGGDSRSSNS